MASLSSVATSAYTDLVRLLRDDAVAGVKGKPTLKQRDDAGSLKASKDREQAAFLVAVLAQDRPDDLAEAYEDALSRGPR